MWLAVVLREVIGFLESLPESAKPEWRQAMQYLFLLIHHIGELPVFVLAHMHRLSAARLAE